MESDAQKKLDVKKSEEMESAGNLQESHDDEVSKPWNGVFYTEGDDEPIIVDSKIRTMGDLPLALSRVPCGPFAAVSKTFLMSKAFFQNAIPLRFWTTTS